MTTIKEMNKAIECYGMEMKRFKWGFLFKSIDPSKQTALDNVLFTLPSKECVVSNLQTVSVDTVIAMAVNIYPQWQKELNARPGITVGYVEYTIWWWDEDGEFVDRSDPYNDLDLAIKFGKEQLEEGQHFTVAREETVYDSR